MRLGIAAPRCPRCQQVRIKGKQPGSREILTGFHVVDPADHQILRSPVDVEECRFGRDLAQAAKALAVDRVDRRLGQAELERLSNFRRVRSGGRGSKACHTPSRRGRQGDDRRQSGAGTQPAAPTIVLLEESIFDHWEFLT